MVVEIMQQMVVEIMQIQNRSYMTPSCQKLQLQDMNFMLLQKYKLNIHQVILLNKIMAMFQVIILVPFNISNLGCYSNVNSEERYQNKHAILIFEKRNEQNNLSNSVQDNRKLGLILYHAFFVIHLRALELHNLVITSASCP